MRDRELTKRNILILQQMEFEAEAELYRGEKTNVEEKYREFIKTLPKNIKNISPYSPDKLEKENSRRETTNLLKSDVIQIQNIANEKTDSSIYMVEPQKRPFPKRIRARKENEKQKEVANPDFKKLQIKNEKNSMKLLIKHRIRYNRWDTLVIDRYIQNDSSFNPFDDYFNKSISKYKLYNEEFEIKRKGRKNFDSLYSDYLKNRYEGVSLSDEDSDGGTFNLQVKSFSSSFKHYLKHKRIHPEITTV